MSVFVDTSGLYAYMVQNESGHSVVVRAFNRLAAGRRTLHTTSYVLIETAALLQHRFGLEAVRDLDQSLAPLLTIEWVGPELHRRGVERLFREDHRGLSLVDCVSLEFMRSADLREALCLDAHFSEAGFKLLPARRRSR